MYLGLWPSLCGLIARSEWRQLVSCHCLSSLADLCLSDTRCCTRQWRKMSECSQVISEASNVSEQRDKGWIQVIRVHDTIHLAVTTTRQGNRRWRTTPHKERMSGLVKHRDYPLHSYIVNERYISRNKRASEEKKTNSEWQELVTSPTPNPGRPRNR